METYKKPTVTNDNFANGIFPAVALGFGVALSKGKTKIDSTHTRALPRKKSVE